MTQPVETIDLGEVEVEIDDEAETVTSRWGAGVELVARPVYDEESRARAEALGYPYHAGQWRHAVWAMTRDHDLLHHVVARAEGKPYSRHLRWVAIGNGWADPYEGDREERIVLLLQHALNVGLEGLIA